MNAKAQKREWGPSRPVPWARRFVVGIATVLLCSFALPVQALTPLQEKAQMIDRIDIEQVRFPDPSGLRKPSDFIDVRVVAKTKAGEVVRLTADEARSLFSAPTLHNPVGGKVVEDASPLDPGADMRIKYLKWGSARMEVALKPEFQALSTAQPAQFLFSVKYPYVEGEAAQSKSLWSKTVGAIKAHPYIAGAAGAVAVGGMAVAAAAGGGGDDGGGGGGGGSSDGPLAGTINGGWSGTVSGRQLEPQEKAAIGGSFTMHIGADGSVSGSFSGGASGSISGSVTGGGQLSASAGGGAGVASWSGNILRSGNTLNGSGSWSAALGRGSWSGSGPASN